MSERINVLVMGSGAREHALAHAIRRSPMCGDLFVYPGNAGTAQLCDVAHDLPKGTAPGISVNLYGVYRDLMRFARLNKVEFMVIGPEQPLADGLSDAIRQYTSIKVFGPSQNAARLEWSKLWSREVGVLPHWIRRPKLHLQAKLRTSEDIQGHIEALERREVTSVVVKRDGLAQGKGVAVCANLNEVREQLFRFLADLKGEKELILYEECVTGEEVSMHYLADGTSHCLPLISARDYKRALDGDRGPNTGGMGSYAQSAIYDSLNQELCEIAQCSIKMLYEHGSPFEGCFFPGFMLTDTGPVLLEVNTRFGDPETQSVLPLMKTDLLALLRASSEHALPAWIDWRPETVAVSVVLASALYPGSYTTGHPITGLETAESMEGVHVFHAGTALVDGQVVTAGGRVLTVTATADTFTAARQKAYAAVDTIHFEGMQFRTDIAAEVAQD